MGWLLKLLLPLWDFNAYPHAVGWEVGGGGGMFPDNEHHCFPPSKHLLQKDLPLPILSLLWLPTLDMLFPVDINVLLEVTPRAALSVRTLRRRHDRTERRTLTQKISIRKTPNRSLTLWICHSLNEQHISEARASGLLIKSDLTTTWLQSNDKNFIWISAPNVNPNFGISSFAKLQLDSCGM